MIKKEFDSKPVYDEKYQIIKIKSYDEKINKNFYNKKIPKEGSQCICLSVTWIDSVYRRDKNHYPQVFLEECKCVVKEKRTFKFITDYIEISSDDSDKEDSDKENPDKKNSNEEVKYRQIFV